MNTLTVSESDLRIAAAALAAGKLVAFPTETVYGLGANAYDSRALARVFEAKRRPAFDPLIVHIADLSALDRVADLGALRPEAAEKARLLAERLWPGPLTLILPKRPVVSDLATSGLPSVAVRLPAHPVARRLIELSTGAIAAPSANPFGYLSPTRASHVRAQLGDRVDYIVDGGRCEVGVESTVLDLCGEEPTVLRPGGMEIERISALVGAVSIFDRSVAVPTAPGQLPSHYAPRAPLVLHAPGGLSSLEPNPSEALLFASGASRDAAFAAGKRPDQWMAVRVLSERGDSLEAASNLFDLLHELDSSGAGRIHAERVRPEAGGLAAAVNDRLFKASEK